MNKECWLWRVNLTNCDEQIKWNFEKVNLNILWEEQRNVRVKNWCKTEHGDKSENSQKKWKGWTCEQKWKIIMLISMKIEVEAIGAGWLRDNNYLKVNLSSAIVWSCYKPCSIVNCPSNHHHNHIFFICYCSKTLEGTFNCLKKY